jgi:hypothetical protein
MRLTLILCIICASAILVVGQLMPKASVADHTLRGLRGDTAGGGTMETQLQIREVPLDARMPNGRDGTGALQVLFDPEHKLFQWHLAVELFSPGEPRRQKRTEFSVPIEFASGSRMAYVSQDALVTFTVMPYPPALYVQESRDHADSIAAATEASLKAAAEKLGEYQREGSSYGKAIRLFPQLRNDFFCTPPCDPRSAAMVPLLGGAKITGVSMRNGGWEVVVQGRWTEKIVLNNKFELVTMTRAE